MADEEHNLCEFAIGCNEHHYHHQQQQSKTLKGAKRTKQNAKQEFCSPMSENKEQCKREDCIYRSIIRSGGKAIPCCMYAAIRHMSRNCPISECDKYQPGKKIKPRIEQHSYDIVWEYEIYERKEK